MRYFINLLLVIAVSIFSIVRGNVKGAINTRVVQGIVVVQMAQLGDMICTTHIFHHIKNRYPNAKLFVIGKEVNKEVLGYNKDIDEYIIFNENKPWDLYKFLKKSEIDVGILTTTHFTSLAVLFLSGIKCIIAPTVVGGYSPFETKSYKIIRKLVTIVPIRASKNLHKEYLKLLKPLGINEISVNRHLGFSEMARKNAQLFFDKHNISSAEDFIVMINPSSGNKIKNWPGNRFAQVADYVYEKYGAKIVIIGGPNDEEEVFAMLKALSPKTKVINTLNLFTIDELKAVIASASMFVSVDAGPLNIAIAFDVPTIDILGPVPEWAVQTGEFNRIVMNRGGVEPAIYPLNNREVDFKEARRQAEAITAEMVISEVDDLYAVIKSLK